MIATAALTYFLRSPPWCRARARPCPLTPCALLPYPLSTDEQIKDEAIYDLKDEDEYRKIVEKRRAEKSFIVGGGALVATRRAARAGRRGVHFAPKGAEVAAPRARAGFASR